MSIALCSLVLNEEEWLRLNYLQHKDWPELVSWVFVHGADRMYGLGNPDLVSKDGFSTDDTKAILDSIARDDSRVKVIHHGWMDRIDPAQSKCEGRNRYLEEVENTRPDFLMIVDGDEFYTKSAQARITYLLKHAHRNYTGFVFPQRHVWHPGSIQDFPLFSYEVQGGYWAIPHTRGWRWSSGIRYGSNHNHPEANGRSLNKRLARYSSPTCCHMGFAGEPKYRVAKNRYYVARGEGVKDGRQMYVDCRAAFETWKPAQRLPHGAKVVSFEGQIPECFVKDS